MPSEVELGKSKCMCLISLSGVKIKVKDDGRRINGVQIFVDAWRN